MLLGNYTTYKLKSVQSGCSPRCPLCPDGEEDDDISHIVTSHITTPQQEVLNMIQLLCNVSKSKVNISNIMKCKETMAQFILDPSSLNLQDRISVYDPILPKLFELCQKYCYITQSERLKNLQSMTDNSK